MALDIADLEPYARGCEVLSAGGGGDAETGLIMAERAIEASGPVELVSLEDLDGDALIMPCGLIGAPTVATERIWNGDEGVQLRTAVESHWKRPVEALMCYEVAGANGLLPVTWAARLGLPLVDADGMGRAFPEMQQQAMHLGGISASPLILTDGRLNTVVVQAASNSWAERLARAGAATFGGACAGALYTMTARQARGAVIDRSLSLALRIGAASDGTAVETSERLVAELHGRILITGKIGHIERRAGGRFVHGAATVEGIGSQGGRYVRLEFQNEVLLAFEEGQLLAAVPDIISVLDEDTGRAVVTERLRYGQRVHVLGYPAPAIWRTPEGLQVVGPRAFGYDLEYRPLHGLERNGG
jgi:DUF917 family protein